MDRKLQQNRNMKQLNQAEKVIQKDPENFDRVLAYLMYEKSLITFQEGDQVDNCLEMARNLSTGSHISISNKFEKMVAIVFELVLSREIDPWNIDLVSFAKVYLEQLKKVNELDLFTIGKMVFLAWGILKEKSEILVEKAKRAAEGMGEDREEFDDTEEEPYHWGEIFSEPFDPAVHDQIVREEEPVISEMVWRDSSRKATLMDVVDALADAVDEVERRKVIEERRKLLRENMASEREIKKEISNNFHEDNLERDKEIVWQRINKFNGQPIPLAHICDFKNRKEVISTLISSVHLAQESKIRIWQKNFPFGDIFVKNLQNTKTN